MQKSKIDVHSYELPDLIGDMKAGKLQVPRFQRDFVWSLPKIRALLDSMYKEFPIGTFFLWRAPTGSPPLSRPLEELGLPGPRPDGEVTYILDGQQRLTSLFVVIQGKTFDGRDYSRVCLDLETATRFDQNNEEGFDEPLFVARAPDDQQYVAVCDLVSPNHLHIYNGVPDEWKPSFDKAYRLFHRYPFSVVWIQEQTLADAIEIFQRINQAGQRLSRYDLICANVWRPDFDLRKQIELLNRRFSQSGFGRLDETVYTQTFSLILKDKCTTVAELSLATDEIVAAWNRVVRSLELAVDFVKHNLGVKRAEYLPYRGFLVVLAYYFYHAPNSALSAREREALWHWFWRVTLSERYGSTSPSRMAEDALKLREVMKGQEATFDYPSKVNAETVARTKMSSSSSAIRNAFICMLALQEPKNLKDGSPVNLADDFFSNLKRAERHHIFPVGFLKSRGWAATAVHLVPNFCFIPADLNKEIGSRAPADYLAHFRQQNPQFEVVAESHLLPVKAGAAVWNNDFQAFRTERAQRIADELNRLAGSKPGEFVTPTAPAAALTDVDLLEIRLRDFIDHRLTAVLGPFYWKQAIPSDVVGHVRNLIGEHLTRHPYEDRNEFAAPRRRLDFCDVSHYDKIILKNWSQFAQLFGRKDDVQRYMDAYRTLRNCVAHNRKPTDIEQKSGEAAMMWLGRILDRYDAEISAYSEASEENDDDLVEESSIIESPESDEGAAEEILEAEELEIPELRVPGRGASQALQSVLEEIHANIPQEAAGRLDSFLERIIGWDWQIASQGLGVAFRARALRTPWMSGEPPKSMRTTVLFLRPGEQNGPYMAFPIAVPWVTWEGLDAAPYMDRLRALGCVEGSDGEINLFLREHNSAEVFDGLYSVIKDIFADTERSLAEADH
jgi:hypothetical protein